MELLKKQNWWIWLLLLCVTQGLSVFILAALLKVYDKNAWYAKWHYWLIGIICLFLPALIMFIIFSIQITIKTAAKLDVPGKELYLSPYVWILCLIVPIIGWVCLTVMIIYLEIWPIIMLYRGNGEEHID